MTPTGTAPSERSMRQRVACIGECLVELRSDSANSFATAFAGDTLNTATYLARSGLHQVSFVSVVGTDQISDQMLNAWQRENIDTQLVGRHRERLPGIYLIENDETGERTFRYWRSESAARTLFLPESGLTTDALASQDVIYTSGITLAIMHPEARELLLGFLKQYRLNGGCVAFDSNYRPRLWESADVARHWVMQMWSVADIGLPSLEDEQALFSESEDAQVIRRLLDTGISELILKRGDATPLIFSRGEELECAPLSRIDRVVDTTGAGDSFNGGYLATRLAGEDQQSSVRSAHELAARVITHSGAILPNW